MAQPPLQPPPPQPHPYAPASTSAGPTSTSTYSTGANLQQQQQQVQQQQVQQSGGCGCTCGAACSCNGRSQAQQGGWWNSSGAGAGVVSDGGSGDINEPLVAIQARYRALELRWQRESAAAGDLLRSRDAEVDSLRRLVAALRESAAKEVADAAFQERQYNANLETALKARNEAVALNGRLEQQLEAAKQQALERSRASTATRDSTTVCCQPIE